MMYLLDTCAFIWYLEGSNKLSPKAASILDTCPDIFLSLTTLWEIAIKKTIRKLDLSMTTAELLAICERAGIRTLPISAEYFDVIQELPLIHGDPFDRLIIATAMREKLAILTDDEKIIRYPNVKVVW